MNYPAIANFKGYRCDIRDRDPVWNDTRRPEPSTAEWQEWATEYEEAQRILAIHQLAQATKNASLGKTPEQMAETLKLQVNLGIGGLLVMLQRLQVATGATLAAKGVCTTEEFGQALQTALGPEANLLINQRLAYWDWIVAVDEHTAELIANPGMEPDFPTPPTLNQ